MEGQKKGQEWRLHVSMGEQREGSMARWDHHMEVGGHLGYLVFSGFLTTVAAISSALRVERMGKRDMNGMT